MGNLAKFSRIALGTACIAALAQCGGQKSKSSLAEFKVLPSTPIVFTGDTTDPMGNKVKAPWFQFRLSMKNGSTDTITVIGLTIDIYAEDASGQIKMTESSLSPSDFNLTLADATQCTFGSFGEWTAGEDKSLELSQGPAACAGHTPTFYIGGGSKGASGENFRYRIVVKPQGWFGTYDSPQDRFETQFTFYTR